MCYCTAAVLSGTRTVHVHERCLETANGVHVHSVHVQTRKLFSGYSQYVAAMRGERRPGGGGDQ
jgi:hypothetical protein